MNLGSHDADANGDRGTAASIEQRIALRQAEPRAYSMPMARPGRGADRSRGDRPRAGPSRATEKQLAEIAACRADPTSPEAERVLRAALELGGSFAVAAAAALVGEHELDPLVALLAPAYHRVAGADPGCK